jgi:hypothetical protein
MTSNMGQWLINTNESCVLVMVLFRKDNFTSVIEEYLHKNI